MGFLHRILNRPPNQDQFAKLLLKRIRASGDMRPINYDAANFRLLRGDGNIMFLSNTYQEYLRLAPEEQETLIQNFLATWHTSSMQVSDDFNDVRADILPALRARSFFEVDIHRAAGTQKSPSIPREVIADHLALCLVYDLPTSMMTVSEEQLQTWGVSFYEAMEVAKRNLAETTAQYAQIGPVYSLMQGDAYDATRLVLHDFIRHREVKGDHVAMVPNRERLYVTGSDDDQGLEIMAELAGTDLEHERWISGIPFRLSGDEWQPWIPPTSHRLFSRFKKLWMQTLGRTYAEQTEMLNARHEREGTDIFVASYSGMEDERTSEQFSYCIWTEGVDSLLPKTDRIFLFRPTSDSQGEVVASGEWEAVRRVAGDLMQPQEMYPERWRVREFPGEEMLTRIGLLPSPA